MRSHQLPFQTDVPDPGGISQWSFDRWGMVVSIVVAVFFGLLSIYFYKRQKVAALPTHRITKHRLIGPYAPESPFNQTSPDLKIVFQSDGVMHELTQVTKIYMWFWNAGAATIDQEHLIPDEPLRLELSPQSRFLGTPKVLAATRDSINFQVSMKALQPNVANMTFSFLDRADGALVEFLCGGPTEGAQLKGSFKGARTVRKHNPYPLVPERSFRSALIGNAAKGWDDPVLTMPPFILWIFGVAFINGSQNPVLTLLWAFLVGPPLSVL